MNEIDDETIIEFQVAEYRVQFVADQPFDMKTEEGRIIYSIITEQIEAVLRNLLVKVGPFRIYIQGIEKSPKLLGFEMMEEKGEENEEES